TFAASGTMKWGAYPHPFVEIMRKTFTEMRHQLDPNRLYLFGLGVDAEKLYFQFSFYEEAVVSAKQVIDFANQIHSDEGAPTCIDKIPFSLDAVARLRT